MNGNYVLFNWAFIPFYSPVNCFYKSNFRRSTFVKISSVVVDFAVSYQPERTNGVDCAMSGVGPKRNRRSMPLMSANAPGEDIGKLLLW
jgi:hypothetical protein